MCKNTYWLTNFTTHIISSLTNNVINSVDRRYTCMLQAVDCNVIPNVSVSKTPNDLQQKNKHYINKISLYVD